MPSSILSTAADWKSSANRRGYYSLWIFLGLFILSLFAQFIANDKPILVYYDDAIYMPIFKVYPETALAASSKPKRNIEMSLSPDSRRKGWALWPIIRYSYDTINYSLDRPAPSPPTKGKLVWQLMIKPGMLAHASLRLSHFCFIWFNPRHYQLDHRRSRWSNTGFYGGRLTSLANA